MAQTDQSCWHKCVPGLLHLRCQHAHIVEVMLNVILTVVLSRLASINACHSIQLAFGYWAMVVTSFR